MFDKSYFDTLQDYIASGCTMELTADELDYYNALYALVGINRKYGKDNAIGLPDARAVQCRTDACPGRCIVRLLTFSISMIRLRIMHIAI